MQHGAASRVHQAVAAQPRKPPCPASTTPSTTAEVGSRDSTLDTTRIDDVRIGAVRPLITPALLQERVPCATTRWRWSSSRAAIADVLHGRDDRLLVVVGPCSIHDHDQALEYARA
jgi:3-deoxy-7-phosphoheptulonate synthase